MIFSNDKNTSSLIPLNCDMAERRRKKKREMFRFEAKNTMEYIFVVRFCFQAPNKGKESETETERERRKKRTNNDAPNTQRPFSK